MASAQREAHSAIAAAPAWISSSSSRATLGRVRPVNSNGVSRPSSSKLLHFDHVPPVADDPVMQPVGLRNVGTDRSDRASQSLLVDVLGGVPSGP